MATNFYLDNRTDKNGDAPIRISINICGARFVTSTTYKISPTKWNVDKQRVKKGSSNSKGILYTTINKALDAMCSHFSSYENECIASSLDIDANALKKEFNAHFGKKKADESQEEPRISLFDCFDTFMREESKQKNWTYRMVQKFRTLKNHLQAYDKKIEFETLTESKIGGFVDFLRDRKELVNSTISKQLALLKWFLRWAAAKGYNVNDSFKTYTPKLKTGAKKVIFLEWAELMRVYEYEVPANGTVVALESADRRKYEKTIHEAAALAKTRDIFCFCCFTSLRYSDAANLKWSDINGSTMSITTIKTADLINIDLNKYALSILERYRPLAADNGGFVFPSITNQRMNLYLKELCELCGINQPITQTHYRGSDRIDETLPKYELMGTHAGRRTFICNALMLGIPAEIVMKWTGHSDYKAMKPYIDIADAAKARAMELFNNI